MKRCPFCAEEIQEAAIKCRFCGSDLQGSSTIEQAPPEHIFFEDKSVKVTNARAIVSGKTYAMANITSVSVFTEPARRNGCGVALIVLGALFCLFLFYKETLSVGVMGVLAIIFGLMLRGTREKFFVRLTSSSGEANVLESHDRGYIERVVAAVNEAIVNRG